MVGGQWNPLSTDHPPPTTDLSPSARCRRTRRASDLANRRAIDVGQVRIRAAIGGLCVIVRLDGAGDFDALSHKLLQSTILDLCDFVHAAACESRCGRVRWLACFSDWSIGQAILLSRPVSHRRGCSLPSHRPSQPRSASVLQSSPRDRGSRQELSQGPLSGLAVAAAIVAAGLACPCGAIWAELRAPMQRIAAAPKTISRVFMMLLLSRIGSSQLRARHVPRRWAESRDDVLSRLFELRRSARSCKQPCNSFSSTSERSSVTSSPVMGCSMAVRLH